MGKVMFGLKEKEYAKFYDPFSYMLNESGDLNPHESYENFYKDKQKELGCNEIVGNYKNKLAN